MVARKRRVAKHRFRLPIRRKRAADEPSRDARFESDPARPRRPRRPSAMSPAASRFFGVEPRLHYLEWNPGQRATIVMMHGNSASAWWWEPVAEAMGGEFRLLAP